MAGAFYRTVLLVAVVAALALAGGCGKSEGQPVAFKAEYRDKLEEGKARILTVAELTGPSGFEPGNLKAGWYVVKGTYDLTGTAFDHGVITFSIDGSYVLDLTKEQANAPLDAAMQPHVDIAKGQLKGSFELKLGIKEVKDKGGGEPAVGFAGNQKLEGSNSTTVHETVYLKKK